MILFVLDINIHDFSQCKTFVCNPNRFFFLSLTHIYESLQLLIQWFYHVDFPEIFNGLITLDNDPVGWVYMKGPNYRRVVFLAHGRMYRVE